MSSTSPNICKLCGAQGNFHRCSKCRAVYYCSRKHQKEDWKREHKFNCGASTSTDTSLPAEPVPGPSNVASLSDEEHRSSTESALIPASSAMPICGENIIQPQEANFMDFPVSTHPFDVQSISSIDDRIDEMVSSLIRDMNTYGVCVLDNFLGDELGLAVLDEVKAMHSRGLFQDGQLVSNGNGNDTRNIRGDKITWIDGRESETAAISKLINRVDSVVIRGTRAMNNGVFGTHNIKGRTKAMVACYPGSGSHYVKHVDNPNQDGRCITAIYYLNLHWDVKRSGGLLRIFPEGWSDKVADIEPVFDRILFFWSDRRNPHEVQPAYDTRYAITLWYFDSVERAAACRRFEKKGLT